MNFEPVFGDLAHWPLRAEVWGTAGNWAAAIGTSASVAAAAYYFIHNNRQAESAQALMIAARLFAQDGSLGVKLSNNSASAIYDIRINLRKLPLKDVILSPGGTPIFESLPDIKRDWEMATDWQPLYVTSDETAILTAGEEFSHVFEGVTLGNMYWCKLTFMDARSVHWQLALRSSEGKQRHQLTKVKFVDGIWEYEPEIFSLTLKQRLGYWNTRRELLSWYRKNKPTKPKD